MHRPSIALIAALARNNVIGQGNRMPWHLPDDLRRFKQLTLGHAVIMGRKTHESIGRPLPGRTNVIISRSAAYAVPGCHVVSSLDAALAAAQATRGGSAAESSVFVIGGGEIYRLALPRASHLLLTEIDAYFAGDAFFPTFDRGHWREVRREQRSYAGPSAFDYAFVDYERRA
jgi:dihydrofolate reductase